MEILTRAIELNIGRIWLHNGLVLGEGWDGNNRWQRIDTTDAWQIKMGEPIAPAGSRVFRPQSR